MENEESRFWGIHTLNDNLFLKDNIIAIGWPKMGDLALVEANREAFKEKYVQVYPEAKKGNIACFIGFKFSRSHTFESSHAVLQGIIRLLEFLIGGKQILNKLHVYRFHAAALLP